MPSGVLPEAVPHPTTESAHDVPVDLNVLSLSEKFLVDAPHNLPTLAPSAILSDEKLRQVSESAPSSICFSVETSSSSPTFTGRPSTESGCTSSTASVVDVPCTSKPPVKELTFMKLLLAHIGYGFLWEILSYAHLYLLVLL